LKKEKVAIIGHFGAEEKLYDGQTIKTKTLYDTLKETGKYELMIVDTYFVKKSPAKLLWETLKCLACCKNIILLVSGRGMCIFFPLLYYWKKLFKINVFHDVIGGTLAKYMDDHPSWNRYLNYFNKNWVEFESLREDLEDRGVVNATVIPNFKQIKKVGEVSEYKKDEYYFCTFSRVSLEKGVEVAIDAIKEINDKFGKGTAKLDIYGQIDKEYEKRFRELENDFDEDIKYCGIVEFNKSTEVLQNYYMLLFPTFHDGEGFPGTIIDALFSALPTIASDWRANAEIIEHLKTGIIYPNKDFPDLYTTIEWAIKNREIVDEMRAQCFDAAENYSPESLVKKMIADIEST